MNMEKTFLEKNHILVSILEIFKKNPRFGQTLKILKKIQV